MPSEVKGESKTAPKPTLIKMGFPAKQLLNYPTLCACHNEFKFHVFICPNCATPSCELSSFCKVCQIMLVSSAHLSRTTQHNQHLSRFIEFKKYLEVKEQPA